MKTRLDIQSLLEDSQKEDLVLFLKSGFLKNKALADDFLIHFASTFDLDESDFHLITDRIRKMLPARLSTLTHQKARMVIEHLTNLIEQTRDCYSRQNYRQAFIIISHIILLLDQYTDQIPEKFGFKKLLNEGYQLLDSIYQESPAPALKAKMRMFLQDVISFRKAIPFDELINPYRLLLDWTEEFQTDIAGRLIQILEEKHNQFPDHRKSWFTQQVRIMADHGMDEKLMQIIHEYPDDHIVYEVMNHSLTDRNLNQNLVNCFKAQYFRLQNSQARHYIYQILKNQKTESHWIIEMTVQEYFTSGNITILEDLIVRSGVDDRLLISYLEAYVRDHSDAEHFYLYSALRYMDRNDLLKDHLLIEMDIFEILPFLREVLPLYSEEMQAKLSGLIESYLTTHFGRPAINFLNNVLDEINHLGYYGLNDFIIRRIHHSFGHRKHLQKLMKELVQ